MPLSSEKSISAYTSPISVTRFLNAAREDHEGPGGISRGSSTMGHVGFADLMPACRARVHSMEEALDSERESLNKLKKAVKAINNSATALGTSEAEFGQCLRNLGEMALQNEDYQPEALGKGFMNFAGLMDAVTKHSRAMYQAFTDLFLYPLETLLKNESIASKGDLKKAIDKAWKDYEIKSSKVEKEKKQSSKESGGSKSDYVTPAELADELLEERRMFQLQMCECLIKENDIRSRKGVDLLSQLIQYYYYLLGYFEDGMKTLKDYQSFIHDIANKAQEIKSKQDEEKKQLLEMRALLKGGSNAHILREKTTSYSNIPNAAATPATNGTSHTGYNLHQLQGNHVHGTNKKGVLYKKCESKMRRKQWQKRKCEVKDGYLSVAHNDESKSPVKLNLLTCQAKVVVDDKRCFDLVSKFRTYHFQAEDENEKEVWLSVILNSKEQVLQQAFGRDATDGGRRFSTNISEIRDTLIKQVQKLPGNNRCCDCDAEKDPTWLSTNFGVLTCIECSGVHREMGVHISRIQSLTLDNLGTAQLLLARTMTNLLFNQIFEGSLNNVRKPTAASTMDDRMQFIRAKYIDKRFVTPSCQSDEQRQENLMNALHNRYLHGLVQLFAEGQDLASPLAQSVIDETPLHFLIRAGDDSLTLPCADFIIQSSRSINRVDRNGNTPLHICADLNRTESMKLLLKAAAELDVRNHVGETPLDIAHRKRHSRCIDLLQYAQSGKKDKFENVEIDWSLLDDEMAFDSGDYSDDEGENGDLSSHAASQRRSFRLPRPGNTFTPLPPMSVHPVSPLKPNPPPNLHNYFSGLYQKPVLNTSQSMTGSSSKNSSVTSFTTFLPPAVPPQPRKETALNSSQSHYAPVPKPVETGLKLRTQSTPKEDSEYKAMGHRRSMVLDQRHSRATSDPKTVQEMVRVGSVSEMPNLPPKNKFVGMHPTSAATPPAVAQKPLALTESFGSAEFRNNGAASKPKVAPRRRNERGKRCKALFDCDADHPDELTFEAGEIITIVNDQTDDENWMEGIIESAVPPRRGLFPVSFVHMLPDS
ncbi:arfGAP with SH3 domain, ANK repeat and PH domain-containing protein-like isoform X2 [Paramacrobiotus metropolitanus]|nr:arfGAP with SH3 domain, ANK repeat and PH domain-containing protein-like isoform X2 [Paramacrobiotus metropolitanus]